MRNLIPAMNDLHGALDRNLLEILCIQRAVVVLFKALTGRQILDAQWKSGRREAPEGCREGKTAPTERKPLVSLAGRMGTIMFSYKVL